ncbi:pyridoxamine 5'-phosphate oxidase family protein [Candidatus Bathyarchaeota archaeon]|nr:pyridoxamine 5'-phosphate oxidase family protein [Candidatus Bathyarchaeota archaeon]
MDKSRYHLRRKDKELTDPAEIKGILKSCNHVTVAMCSDNSPYLVTLNHGYDEENNCLYFHCAKEGRKIEIWKENPVVWGQAILDLGYQKGICEHFFKTAQFEGRVSFAEGRDEKLKAIRYLISQLEEDPEAVEALHFKSGLGRIDGINVGKIDITFLSGKEYSSVA